MASFFGHLYGGAAVSAGAALAVEGLKWAPPDRVPLLFALGVAGGLLPDIDSDGSTPVRVFFTLLGVTAAFLICFWLIEDYPVQVLALVWAGVFLFVRFGVFEVFSRLTVHRGIWHSWLAAAFAGLALVDAVYHFGGFSLAGFFLVIGYLTHLCLDEVASLDLLGARVKRSFGTALKPFSIAAPLASVAMLLGVLGLAYQAPTIEPVVAAAGRVRAEYLSTPLWGSQGHKKPQAELL